MPFIWNDETYWERYKKSGKVQAKVFLPMLILSVFIWSMLETNLVFSDLLFISFMSAVWFFSLINIYFQFPNAKIPDYYSKEAQTLMYIILFLVTSFGVYFIYTTLGVKIIV